MKKILFFSFILSSVTFYAAEGTFGPIKKTFSQIYWQNVRSFPTDGDLVNMDQSAASDDSTETDRVSKIRNTPWYPLPAPTPIDEARFFNRLSELTAHGSRELERMAYVCPFCRGFGTDIIRDMGVHLVEKHPEHLR